MPSLISGVGTRRWAWRFSLVLASARRSSSPAATARPPPPASAGWAWRELPPASRRPGTGLGGFRAAGSAGQRRLALELDEVAAPFRCRERGAEVVGHSPDSGAFEFDHAHDVPPVAAVLRDQLGDEQLARTGDPLDLVGR